MTGWSTRTPKGIRAVGAPVLWAPVAANVRRHGTIVDERSPSKAGGMYENYKLCSGLVAGELCFRVQKYSEGEFEEVFHEHVPAPRLSQDGRAETLRALVANVAEWPPTYVLRSSLNRRGRNPPVHPGFVHNTTFPERGVLRQYVSSSNVTAWVDAVVSPSQFRSESKGERGAV